MKTQYHKLALTASLVLATALTFSCSSDTELPPLPPPNGNSDVDSSDSSGGGSSSSNNAAIIGYCDYGPITQYGGGCFPMATADDQANCAKWGNVVNSCDGTSVSSSAGGNLGGSSSSNAPTGPCTAANNTNTQYCSNGTLKTYGSVRDRDGKSYKTVVIGTQTWMAENLAVAVNESVNGSFTRTVNYSRCYEEVKANCDKYGKLYDWATAMALGSACNVSSGHCDYDHPRIDKYQGLCPSGWHIPNVLDWNKLLHYVDGTPYVPEPDPFHEEYYESETAGRYLKAASGWGNGEGGDGSGEDKFGFAALPGGSGYTAGDSYVNYETTYDYYSGGSSGLWWSNGYYSQDRSGKDFYYRMNGYNTTVERYVSGGYGDDGTYHSGYYEDYIRTNGSAYPDTDWKTSVFSIRCVKD